MASSTSSKQYRQQAVTGSKSVHCELHTASRKRQQVFSSAGSKQYTRQAVQMASSKQRIQQAVTGSKAVHTARRKEQVFSRTEARSAAENECVQDHGSCLRQGELSSLGGLIE